MNEDLFSCIFSIEGRDSGLEIIKNHSETLFFRKEELVYQSGDLANGFFYVLSGKVQTVNSNSNGKQIILKEWDKESCFGYVPCFSTGIRTNSVVAKENSALLFMSMNSFNKIAMMYPEVYVNLARVLASLVTEITIRYNDSCSMDLEGRLTSLLRGLCQYKGTKILDISQSDLASYLGVTKEAVSINLNRLKDKDIVNLSYRKIEFLI